MIFMSLPPALPLTQVQTADGQIMWTTTPVANDKRLRVVWYHPNLQEQRRDDTDRNAAEALRRANARP